MNVSNAHSAIFCYIAFLPNLATVQPFIACTGLRRRRNNLPTRAMKNYRVLVFDMGHINAVVELSASDDDAAITEVLLSSERYGS